MSGKNVRAIYLPSWNKPRLISIREIDKKSLADGKAYG